MFKVSQNELLTLFIFTIKISGLKKKKFSVQYIRMIFLSLKDLKAIANSRDIKDYENKSYKDLLTLLNDTNISISKKKSEEIEKNFKE